MANQNLSKWQKQNQFIEALTQMGTIEAACAETKVHRATYYRWQKEEEFQKKIQDKQYFVYNQSMEKMAKLYEDTLATIGYLLYSRNESIQLRAISTILRNANSLMNFRTSGDMYYNWIEMQHDIKMRILADEKFLKEKEKTAKPVEVKKISFIKPENLV